MNVLKEILNPSEEYVQELAYFATTLDQSNPVEADILSIIQIYHVPKFPSAMRDKYFDLMRKHLKIEVSIENRMF